MDYAAWLKCRSQRLIPGAEHTQTTWAETRRAVYPRNENRASDWGQQECMLRAGTPQAAPRSTSHLGQTLCLLSCGRSQSTTLRMLASQEAIQQGKWKTNDTGFGTKVTKVKSWLCPLLVMWPRASYSSCVTFLTCQWGYYPPTGLLWGINEVKHIHIQAFTFERVRIWPSQGGGPQAFLRK